MTERVIKLFRDMSELTAPECAKNCKVPHSCCDPMYCSMAEDYALEKDIVLKHTDHPILKFMGPTGCTVEPHLRPLCTLHTCAIGNLGFKPGDHEWTEKYFRLREQIEIELQSV